MSNHKFPSYYPEGCPPVDAQPERLTAYRLCESRKVSPSDFIPVALKTKVKISPRKKLIQAYGVSVFTDVEGCQQAINVSPKLRHIVSCIACGEIDEDKGVIKKTPSCTSNSHVTWWVYEDVQPHTFFHFIQDL